MPLPRRSTQAPQSKHTNNYNKTHSKREQTYQYPREPQETELIVRRRVQPHERIPDQGERQGRQDPDQQDVRQCHGGEVRQVPVRSPHSLGQEEAAVLPPHRKRCQGQQRQVQQKEEQQAEPSGTPEARGRDLRRGGGFLVLFFAHVTYCPTVDHGALLYCQSSRYREETHKVAFSSAHDYRAAVCSRAF